MRRRNRRLRRHRANRKETEQIGRRSLRMGGGIFFGWGGCAHTKVARCGDLAAIPPLRRSKGRCASGRDDRHGKRRPQEPTYRKKRETWGTPDLPAIGVRWDLAAIPPLRRSKRRCASGRDDRYGKGNPRGHDVSCSYVGWPIRENSTAHRHRGLIAGVGTLESGDVEFFHLHHGLHDPACFGWILVLEHSA